MAVHQRRATYDIARPFGAWLYAIARYKLIDALRRGRAHLRASAEEADALFQPSGSGSAEAAMAAALSTVIFLIVVAAIAPIAAYLRAAINVADLAALLVALIAGDGARGAEVGPAMDRH